MGSKKIDIVIIGAGISGIAAAYNIKNKCPNKTYLLLEGRDSIGGTWDLFKYPGIRSDSDMCTMGYRFKPWVGKKVVADGPSILEYLKEIVSENKIDQNIRFNQMVDSASWSTEKKEWSLTINSKNEQTTDHITCDFVVFCGGYYNYSQGYQPKFLGENDFKGQIIHPQQWPSTLDYKNKNVVVIGSGATAVTIIPSMANETKHITMLQRSPTYYIIGPEEDPLGNFLRKYTNDKLAYIVVRWKNILFSQWFFFNRARAQPKKVKEWLIDQVKNKLGPNYNIEKHFTPTYNPWDQRICLVPGGDFFDAINEKKATVITDHIERFTEHGITLKSGKLLEADMVITATGLNMEVAGDINIDIDGKNLDISSKMFYKSMMIADVPNMVVTFGYTNASWTLKADLTAEYTCRLINHIDKKGYDYCVAITDETIEEDGVWLDFTSGYVERAKHKFPKQGAKAPWTNTQQYLSDLFAVRYGRIKDKDLKFF
ncbi:MAG: NAD(P)/FAD-dependent oxidoreductase [Gammaproteobacteria bacterium]|nr:NAD(P)/FAD-dependent oxidoreductase [Gammaproteobacteria bacterium]